jgi:hypothetical protein
MKQKIGFHATLIKNSPKLPMPTTGIISTHQKFLFQTKAPINIP